MPILNPPEPPTVYQGAVDMAFQYEMVSILANLTNRYVDKAQSDDAAEKAIAEAVGLAWRARAFLLSREPKK